MATDTTRPADSSSAPGAPRAEGPGDGKPTEAFKSIFPLLAEGRAYGSYWLAAKVDGIKGRVLRIGLYAVLGMAAGLAAAAGLVAAVVLVLMGLSELINAAWENQHPWIGPLIIGGGILIVAAIGGVVGAMLFIRAMRNKTRRKYERKRQRQRIRLGHDVAQRAGEKGAAS